MKTMIQYLVLATLLAVTTLAYGVSCPSHYGSTCWPNGKYSPAGAKGYTCSCGDQIWVGN